MPYVPLFIFLVLFVVGAYVYLAAKTLRNAIWKKRKIQDIMPNVSITCLGLTPPRKKTNLWKTDEHTSSKTLTMRGINSE